MNILKLITPSNLKDEKDKFLADNNYHPEFEYSWETQPLVNDSEDPKKIALYQAVLDQDNDSITNAAKDYFSVDMELMQQEAISDLGRNYETIAPFEIAQLIEAYEQAFIYFDLDHEIVVNDHPGYGIRPQHKERKLYISKAYSYQYMDIKGSVKHEMAHLIRYENGRFNGIKRAPDYLPTEEGLATFVQDYTPQINPSLFQHAAEYEASRVGIKGSLRDIFDHFIDLGFTKDLAWQRAARHKFGFKDTKVPGDIIKPAMYYYNAKKLVNLNQQEIVKLFRGKISLDEALKAEEYRGRFSYHKIVDFFDLENL
jgi:hypothetical protein